MYEVHAENLDTGSHREIGTRVTSLATLVLCLSGTVDFAHLYQF